MSTKNLARTVIEGGRSSRSGWMRRYANGSERSGVRQVLRGLAYETDRDDGRVPVSYRSGFRDFRDKLSPAERWLDSQVGRPWDLVRSELFARFDARTTPGRHVLFCHMLPSVEDQHLSLRWRSFVVDRHGALRRVSHPRARHRRPDPCLPAGDILPWLGGRRVGERGAVLFWFNETPSGAFRQDRRLTEVESDHWRALPRCLRQEHGPSPVRDDVYKGN